MSWISRWRKRRRTMCRLAEMRRNNVISEAAARTELSVCGEGNIVEADPSNDADCLSHVRIRIIGNGNRVMIGPRFNVRGYAEIDVTGEGNEVVIGNDVEVVDFLLLQILKDCCGGRVHIGPRCSFWRTEIRNYDKGSVTDVGEGCIFSFATELRNTDEHAIFENGNVRNRGVRLALGRHCWIGYGASILKNSVVADGSIVGARAVVSGRFEKDRTILAGIPARVIREDVDWDERSVNAFDGRSNGD